jgi:hypothetical protein
MRGIGIVEIFEYNSIASTIFWLQNPISAQTARFLYFSYCIAQRFDKFWFSLNSFIKILRE